MNIAGVGLAIWSLLMFSLSLVTYGGTNVSVFFSPLAFVAYVSMAVAVMLLLDRSKR